MHCTGAEPSLEVITDQQSALQHSFSDTKIALTLTVLPGQPSDCPQPGKTVKLVPSLLPNLWLVSPPGAVLLFSELRSGKHVAAGRIVIYLTCWRGPEVSVSVLP